jgi:hypothetical protein
VEEPRLDQPALSLCLSRMISNSSPVTALPRSRMLLVEYGQAFCFAFCMFSVTASISLATAAVHKRCRLLSSHSLDPRRGIVVGRTARILCGPETRAPLSEEQIRVCGPTLPPAEHPLDASSAASSPRRSEDPRVDSIKRSLDTLCPMQTEGCPVPQTIHISKPRRDE